MTDPELITAAKNVTPYGEYVFGFLVIVLCTAVIALWKQSMRQSEDIKEQLMKQNQEIKDVLAESIRTNITMTKAVEDLNKHVEGLTNQLLNSQLRK